MAAFKSHKFNAKSIGPGISDQSIIPHSLDLLNNYGAQQVSLTISINGKEKSGNPNRVCFSREYIGKPAACYPGIGRPRQLHTGQLIPNIPLRA